VARNEYLLTIGSTNALLDHYFKDGLPTLMKVGACALCIITHVHIMLLCNYIMCIQYILMECIHHSNIFVLINENV